MVNINKSVNILSFLFFIVSLLSGIVLWLAVDPFRGGRGDYSLFFGLSKSGWNNIHILSSLIFSLLMIVHLVLHKQWIKILFRKNG